MTPDDLNFDADHVADAQPRSPYRPNLWTVRDRAYLVVKYLGIALALVGAACEAPFWWFWLTSGRATATITWKEESIVGWGFTRGGMAFPIIDTGFHHRFRTADGRDVQTIYWVRGRSTLWEIGASLDVMYPRSRPGESQPASVSYYLVNDLGWQMAHLSLAIGLIMAGLGAYVVRRTRQQHEWLQRAIAPANSDETSQ